MAEVIPSIHKARRRATRGINAVAAIRCEGMRLARNAVRDRMRAQKIKVNYVSAAEITAAAKAWFRDHPELAQEAFGNVIRWQLQRLLRRAKISTHAQRANAQKSMASTVQISGA